MLLLGGITLFMAYQAQFIKWSYTRQSIVPDTDEEMMYFQSFKQKYGEDGNVLIIAMKDSSVYDLEQFRNLYYLDREITKIDGVTKVLGMPSMVIPVKNTQERKFDLEKVFKENPESQQELDSLLKVVADQQFYMGQLVNPENGATLIAVTIDPDILVTKKRENLIGDIVRATDQFQEVTGIDIKLAGLPYVQYVNTTKVKAELNLFLILSVIITGIILFLFFRSLKAVIFPLIIIGVIVIWVIGTISLLNYEITLLTGLIPPIIVVIGIPNSVYMLNKYHHEYTAHGDKMLALSRIIRKIGVVTLITNITTAIGFFVLISTRIDILVEFGTVAGINILGTFVVSVILIPAVFSYVPPPSPRHLRHLNFKILGAVLSGLDTAVKKYRLIIFVLAIVVVAISLVGASKIQAVSYMVDDIPANSELKQDLNFLEENFGGVMPLEIVVDTGQKKGVQNLSNLRRIDQLTTFLDSLNFVSPPVSPVSLIKASRQAYYNNSPAFYGLPNNRDRAFILRYLRGNEASFDMASTFIDSTGQELRISMRMEDVGSVRMDSIVNEVIQPRIDSAFQDSDMKATITGSTYIYIKGNRFLIKNLITSMIIAFVIIAFIMGALFRNFKMILISIVPNMIPLIITGGLMGYFGIPLKPSTALIFSIAFGISVDDSIHFLAKYRQELFANKFRVSAAVSKSLRETGASMIYTSIILFFGFVIFVASEFGGTVNLGRLTSITLLFAMLANLVVLPALLLQFDSGKRNKNIHPLIEQYPELAEAEIDDK